MCACVLSRNFVTVVVRIYSGQRQRLGTLAGDGEGHLPMRSHVEYSVTLTSHRVGLSLRVMPIHLGRWFGI